MFKYFQVLYSVHHSRIVCLIPFTNSVVNNQIRNFTIPKYRVFVNDACNRLLHTDKLGVKISEEDTFGLIAEKQGIKVFHDIPQSPDMDEDEEEMPYVRFHEKKSAHAFHARCLKLAKQNRIDECCDLLEHEMLKVQKVRPLENNFSVVLGALARHGDTEKTINLYYKLKSYNIVPSAPTYTALFNAIANSKTPIHMEFLRKEYAKAVENKVYLNRKTHNALLKAYAKHESLKDTMAMFRESIIAGFEPDVITFTHLLLCCEKDEFSGFRTALQIWRQMVGLGITPDAACLMQLLLVMVRCSIGDVNIANTLLLQPQQNNLTHFLKRHVRRFRWLKYQESLPNPVKYDEVETSKEEPLFLDAVTQNHQIAHGNSSDTSVKKQINTSAATKDQTNIESVETSLSVEPPGISKINLLQSNHNLKVVSIQKCPLASDRLELIGGIKGVLDIMKLYNIEPSAKLFSVLARSLEDSCKAEDDLIQIAEELKVRVDVDFFNCIMHRRAKRNQHKEAKAIVQKIECFNLVPNYRTWCVCAMSCKWLKDGKELINCMKNAGVKPGVVFFTTLITATIKNPKNRRVAGYPNVWYPNFRYLTYLLDEIVTNNVVANEALVKVLERAASWPSNYNRWELADPILEKEIADFRKTYREWLNNTDFDAA